jgi:hypothetical protein
VVYFFQGIATGLIKIGWTEDDGRKRLRVCQSHSPDQVVPLAMIPDAHDDAPYHYQFRNSWDHGEWFRPTPDLMEFIATLSSLQLEQREVRNNHIRTERPPRPLRERNLTKVAQKKLAAPKSKKTEREQFADFVLVNARAAKAGSGTQSKFLKMYAQVRGWTSGQDVPTIQERIESEAAGEQGTEYAN